MNKDLTIPKKLEPIVKAFDAESPEAAKALILQAAQAIYGDENSSWSQIRPNSITPEDLKNICALMSGMQPEGTLELLLSAQVIVTHMLGMIRLSQNSCEDQSLGLKMLNFSREAVGLLHRKQAARRGIYADERNKREV